MGEVWVVNANTLVIRIHRDPRHASYQDRREVGADEQLVPTFAPALAVTLGTLDFV